MEKVYGIIYKTTCLVNGKIYIGQTTQLENKSYIGSGTSLTLAIKKYGKENFIREILKECYNQTELDEWEDLLIWEYNSRDKSIGYNIAKGATIGIVGETNPSKLPEVRAKISEAKKNMSEETRAKMSKALKGKKYSEETRHKMSEARKGKKLSEETKSKMSEVRKGKTHSEETRIKMSESSKNISDKTRAKMSEAQKGKKMSEEAREKMSASKKGKKISDETRAKLSKQVCQYDKQGNFIAEYYGASEAERQTDIANSSIIACCKGKLKSAGGYIWKYK